MAALAIGLCLVGAACKKDDGGAGGAAGGAGNSGDAGAPACVNTGDINPDCPAIAPLNGACAGRGQCCHRASNEVKEAALGPDDPLVLEYRLNFSGTVNHPMTIGTDLIKSQTAQLEDTEQQSLLVRFTLPRQGGQEVSGTGKSEVGIGRYNCDGTYSFYGKTAAPPVDDVRSAPDRWAAEEVDAMIDVTKTGIDRVKIPFATNPNRKLEYTPYLNLNTWALDWELVNQGFKLTQFDLSPAGRDCMGSRSSNSWMGGGQFVVYTPIDGNTTQIIASIAQTYCELVEFGVLPYNTMGTKDPVDCVNTPRCMPDGGKFGDGGCDWVKLPDALCPTTDAERQTFGCHLGARGNVNMEDGYPADADLSCTMDAPTTPQDPDLGPAGQCCDPLGHGTDNLPACNAYRVINDLVAAAAEITDDVKNDLQPNCPLMQQQAQMQSM